MNRPWEFGDLITWMQESFVFLHPSTLNATLIAEIWVALGVPKEKQSISPMYACTCKSYMHYLWCEHLMCFHWAKGQVNPNNLKRSHSRKRVKSINIGKKQKVGRPAARIEFTTQANET